MVSDNLECSNVTPLAGVWIEIIYLWMEWNIFWVTPLAGVWIEITPSDVVSSISWSLPLRECGLKFCNLVI